MHLNCMAFKCVELNAMHLWSTVYTSSAFNTSEVSGRTTSILHKSKKKTQKHYGLHVKKRKNTMVLAPRQRRNPQRGYVCMSKNAKARRFWHRAKAETRRGLSAATKKSSKHGFSTATRRLPAEGCPRPERNVKKRRLWHRDPAITRRGLSAQIKKRKKRWF